MSTRMGKRLKDWFDEIKARWMNQMPVFFKNILWVCALVSGTALAINTALVSSGATPPDWWSNVFPYLIGSAAGAAFIAKFTQDNNNK